MIDPHCHTLRHQEVSPFVVMTVAQQQLRGKKQQLVFAKHHILLNALLGGASYSSITEAFGRKTCNLYEQSCMLSLLLYGYYYPKQS